MKDKHGNPIDQSIEAEIAVLEDKLKCMGGLTGPRGNISPETHLAFLRSVYAFETMDQESDEPGIDLEQELKERLDPPPDPDLLDDGEVEKILHAMIELLANFHLLLSCTDHLDNRGLYRMILDHVVKEPLVIRKNPGGEFVHQDCCPFEDDKVYPDDYPDVADRDRWISTLQRKYMNKPLPGPAAVVD